MVGPHPSSTWTFLSNHGHVLVCIALDPDARVRDIAERVHITERAVQRILGELEEAGVLRRDRFGRRNRYSIDGSRPLRHPLEADFTVSDLLHLLRGLGGEARSAVAPSDEQGRGHSGAA